MKEIDLFLNEEERESMDSEAHLKRMLELSDKAAQIHHPVAKKKVGVTAKENALSIGGRDQGMKREYTRKLMVPSVE
jgi:hypothetical protein